MSIEKMHKTINKAMLEVTEETAKTRKRKQSENMIEHHWKKFT